MDTNDFDIIDDVDLLADVPAADAQDTPSFTLPEVSFDDEVDSSVEKETKEKPEGEEEVEIEKENVAAEGETSNSVFQEYADNLVEMNIFVPEEGEEKVVVNSPEEFAERFQKSYQKGAINHIESIVGQYGPEYADAFDAIFVKGLPPNEYFGRQEQIQNYEELNLETENSQKLVYRDYMSRQGFTTERIEAKLQKLLDMGELEEEAKDYHERLVASEKVALQQRTEQVAQQQEQYAQQQAAYTTLTVSTIDSKLKEKQIDGIPLTAQKAQTTKEYLLQPKYKLPSGATISSFQHFLYELEKPENIELKIKVALLAQENFKTDSIAKKAISEKSTQLFQNLSNKEKQVKRTSTTQKGVFDPFNF